MRGMTVTRWAFVASALAHVLLFSAGVGMRTAPPEPLERIEIRLATPDEPEVPEKLPVPVEAVRPRAESSPVAENGYQRQVPLPRPAASTAPVPPPPLPVMPPAPAVQPGTAQAPPSPLRGEAAVPAPAVAPPAPAPRQVPREGGVAAVPVARSDRGEAKKAPRLAEYLALVRGKVEEQREYPTFAKQAGQQGTVVVRAAVRGDGSVGEVTVVASSGHRSLDRAALGAVRKAAPFRPPGGYGLGEVAVEIPITYRLNH